MKSISQQILICFFHICPTLKDVRYVTPGMIQALSKLEKLKNLSINSGFTSKKIPEIFANLTALVHLRQLNLFVESYDKFFKSLRKRKAALVAFLQLAEAFPDLEMNYISQWTL